MKTVENPIVPWSGRGHLYTEEEIQIVVQAMRDADPQSQGRYQKLFESRFLEFAGVRSAFATSSCSGALQLTAMLLKLKPGDEVILPAHTFAATAIPFGRSGAKLVWADIDPETRVISPGDIIRKITPRTRAIVVVHLYGLMADMDAIMKIGRQHGIAIVEDAAQSLGATYKGKRAGSYGDLSCFSFQSHKNMTTLGEGGMLAVNREDLIPVVAGLRHNGMRPYTMERDKYWVPAMTNVDFDWDGVWPYKFCLGEAQCALGAKMLERIDRVNEERRRRAHKVMEALRDFPELSFQKVPTDCTHVYHLLSARYDGAKYGKTRDDFIERVAFTHKVQTIVQYYPLYRYPMFQKAGFGEADCPHTDAFYDNMISLPFQHWLREDQIDEMITRVRATLEELRR